jgi:uncharacterized membrane protein
MDILTVILLLVIVILIINNKSGVNQKLDGLEYKIEELQNLLEKQKRDAKPEEKPWTSFPDPVKPPTIKLPVPPKPAEPQPEIVVERQKEVFADNRAVTTKPVRAPEPEILKPAEPELSFFERYPDLEKFIGENLVNKIGIAILVLAIGFFVKYAIDNDWVGPVGRVGIGIFCGAILIGFAHRMRNNYKAFSSVLVGGGLAVFYFTITLAYQQFHLFAQPVGLGIMVVITVFAVILALLYDKQELAVIALVGGFASPFLVNSGVANYTGLFSYLFVLNAGLLIIAYFKAWRILNITAFILSIVFFATVLFTLPASAYSTAFWFATVFYLLFFVINVVNNIRENKVFVAIDFSILLINTALYFSAGLYILTQMEALTYRGLFAASLAALNLLLSFILFKTRKTDPNILYLLIGITLTFISLTAPIQLHGHYITLFWACEAVLLYWLYLKSHIKLMKLTSLIVWVAMLLSLIMDLIAIYTDSSIHIAIIINKGFITTLFAAAGSYLLYLFIAKDPDPQIYGLGIYKTLYRVVALALLFSTGVLEINHQFLYYYPGTSVNVMYLALYTAAFVYLFIIIASKIHNKPISTQFIISLLVCTIAIYLVLNPLIFELLGYMLAQGKIPMSHFYVHWLSALFIGLLFYKLIIFYGESFSDDLKIFATWVLAGAVVLFLSFEFCLLSEQLFYSKANTIDTVQTVYIKTVLPVLWGLLSFTLMWMGMRTKQRILRIISLSLFTITLIKLFLFDINNIPVAGKIAAFFCLGVLLLIVSFMYQKVKKIITDDEAKPQD